MRPHHFCGIPVTFPCGVEGHNDGCGANCAINLEEIDQIWSEDDLDMSDDWEISQNSDDEMGEERGTRRAVLYRWV